MGILSYFYLLVEYFAKHISYGKSHMGMVCYIMNVFQLSLHSIMNCSALLYKHKQCFKLVKHG